MSVAPANDSGSNKGVLHGYYREADDIIKEGCVPAVATFLSVVTLLLVVVSAVVFECSWCHIDIRYNGQLCHDVTFAR